MFPTDRIAEMIEYRGILVMPNLCEVLGTSVGGVIRLPRMSIPADSRPAEQLQEAVRTTWNLPVVIVDFLSLDEGVPCYAVAEVLDARPPIGLIAVPIRKILVDELSEKQWTAFSRMLPYSSDADNPVISFGWIDEAIHWVESATERTLESKLDIRQLNAGGGFTLLRFSMAGSRNYWLKATAYPNIHEFAITVYLAQRSRKYLPELIATKPAWNAWLMSGQSTPISDLLTCAQPSEVLRLFVNVVRTMAMLQMETVGTTSDLLGAGAFDQSVHTFAKNSRELFEYLERAMSLQVSTKICRLSPQRLQEIRTVFDSVCDRVEALQLPETIVHGDINRGNIVSGPQQVQFIDWCETYVGSPFITLQHLLMLPEISDPAFHKRVEKELKQTYRQVWTAAADPSKVDEAFIYMPILAIASALYARGEWLSSARSKGPHKDAHARTLARCMDRAARDPQLLEVLCS